MAVKKDPHTNLDFVFKNLLAGGKYFFLYALSVAGSQIRFMPISMHNAIERKVIISVLLKIMNCILHSLTFRFIHIAY